MSPRRRAGRQTPAARRGRLSLATSAGVVVILAVIGISAWLLVRPFGAGEGVAGSGGLPGPIGGPSVAMDVNTLVGKPAPAFTLSDSDGRSYTMAPGHGRPVVLITHMGIT